MSRKPSVMSSAVFAPVRSTMVLMAMVDPCRNSAASLKRVPALATPCEMPSTRRPGVDSALPSNSRPLLSSNAATSVKVPPMSAARRVRIFNSSLHEPRQPGHDPRGRDNDGDGHQLKGQEWQYRSVNAPGRRASRSQAAHHEQQQSEGRGDETQLEHHQHDDAEPDQVDFRCAGKRHEERQANNS